MPGQTNTDCPERFILGSRVHCTSYDHASSLVLEWASQRLSRYVCVATVNNIMEAWDSPRFKTITNQADLVTPDGMPLVWGLKFLGCPDASRVYGPDLTPIVLQRAMNSHTPVGFYGSSPAVLDRLQTVLARRFPALQIAYAFSPPFRPLTAEEDEEIVTAINRSGARLLFIGLNTPKQDFWMSHHRGRVNAVMLGVGAAFDFLAGTKSQAPRWMMRIGLEWFYRLVTEPRRLWKRYLKHNPRFIVLFTMQLLGWLKFPEPTQREATSSTNA
ncbi:MAG TPA: WecB/TagA/CpsF family glycosyltransferase [Bryobacteraceae bacterium]|jgi:N-acetylglucosaminyldiphosphoundecaprenol N-acetyl-beta-D-mannosaminyltransferase|nr:WecB/TagA/CpsF family glycosyltransferase [Bryobacteraceae bacterium]